MTTQVNADVRNDSASAFETRLGASPILRLRSGPPPADTAASRTGTVLVTMALPSDPFTGPVEGVLSKSGTWEDTSADASGRVGHAEFVKADGTTVVGQCVCAGPWTPATNFAVGDTITNDSGKFYRCTTAGVSASSGGPTGTTTGITDGAAVWSYLQTAGADMTVNAAYINATQYVAISTFSYSALGA